MSTERFTRLAALAERGATEGERDTARRKLDQALTSAADDDQDRWAQGSILRLMQVCQIRKARG